VGPGGCAILRILCPNETVTIDRYCYVRLPDFEPDIPPLHRSVPTDTYVLSFILYDSLHKEYIGKDSVRAEQVLLAAGREGTASSPPQQTSFENVHSAQCHYLSNNHSAVNANHSHIVYHNDIHIIQKALGPIYNF